MNLKLIFYLFSMVIVLSFAACKEKVVEPKEEGGPGIIVPGIGVEGIKLGDSKETVEASLGKPTNTGWADGSNRSWRDITYAQDPLNKISFNFIDEGKGYGPLDMISVFPPYAGKTREGISIGNSIKVVRGIYGLPQQSYSQGNYILDTYCFNGRETYFRYIDSLVTIITIGYYVPFAPDTANVCK